MEDLYFIMFGQIILQVVLILFNALFAATEIALISLNEKKVRSLAEGGDKKAKKMLKIIEEPTKFLSAIQIGITLAGFLGSAFAADNFADKLTDYVVRTFSIPQTYVAFIDTVSVILITLILSYFTLILGELVPKRLAMKYKEQLANKVSGLMMGITVVLRPVIWFLTASTNLVLRLFGIDPKEKDETVSEEDIVIMLDAGADEGSLNHDDITYIKNVFKLDRLTATDVMTPRGSVVAIERNTPNSEIIKLIEEEGYSRIPVYDEDIDKMIGILHTRKFLLRHNNPNFKLEDVMLEPIYVPQKVHLDSLFKQMQQDHVHMVVVVDEYGSVAGVVTMEDILEEIVGDIWDEQDEAVEPIVMLEENKYKVLTSMSLDQFFDYFNMTKPDDIESSTVNGWLSEMYGGIPEVGCQFEYEQLSMVVTKAEEQMSTEIELTVKPTSLDEDMELSDD